MAESPMLWHQELKSVSEAQGFALNPCDPCVANKKANGSWMMMVWHVDDLKISHKEKDAVEGFVKWLEDKHNDKNGKVTIEQGPRQTYIGMILDFSMPGALMVDQSHCIKEMIQEFEEQAQSIGSSATIPWNDKLFQVDESSDRLKAEQADLFHTFVAKAQHAAFRGRPDLKLTVAFLLTRAQKP